MAAVFKVRIRRSDPGRRSNPTYHTYEVEADDRATVLELLKEIYKSHDGEVSFRWSCGTGKCGACVVRVNGRRTLACRHIAEAPELTIEPVRDHPLIRDLTVALEESTGESRVKEESRQGGEK
jgi:succinate dehydrogenase/fumarate reductase iron-sulfur protein